MRTYLLKADKDLDGLEMLDVDRPIPGKEDVLVRVRANSLNFRDTLMLKGGYPRNDNFPFVPLSDMAGEIVELGEGVHDFMVGDRVAANFMRNWETGPLTETALRSSHGGGIDGFLAEYATVPTRALVKLPPHLTFVEAATLPCAALTAWNALISAALRPGQTVLVLGTGGVSIFGLQFAKASGARVIVTSSSNEKLAKAKALGGDILINYRDNPEWHEHVRDATDGVGVDNILEVGGPGTLEQSLKSVRVGGTVSLIGLLSMGENQPSMVPALLNGITVRGVYVGSTEMFRQMNHAITANAISPAVDSVFPFDEAREAYEYFISQKHFGKVVIAD
jgi:NADPH:quinone reductase-like Zn-dependent oxidoreductase